MSFARESGDFKLWVNQGNRPRESSPVEAPETMTTSIKTTLRHAEPQRDFGAAPSREESSLTQRLLICLIDGEIQKFYPDGDLPLDLYPATRQVEACKLDAAEWLKVLKDFAPTALLTCWSTPAIPEEIASDPESPLRYICHITGTVRRLVPRSFFERGGIVTNWGPLAGGQVAEQALLLALASLRNIGQWRQQIADKHHVPYWDFVDSLRTRTLFGRRVGIHGFGQIAQALVKLLKPFQVKISAYSEGVPPALMESLGVKPCHSLEELVPQSEIFFECEALNPSSERSVTRELLARLPDQALFVNIARGIIVDEAALIAEVRSGRLHTALDVITQEPISPEYPLWHQENALLSPHIGAPTSDSQWTYGAFASANLRRFLNGEDLDGIVSLAAYDRST